MAKAKALCKIAKTQVINHLEQAVEIVNRIQDEPERAEAFCELAKVQAQTDKSLANGLFFQALTIASSVSLSKVDHVRLFRNIVWTMVKTR
jgi:hypothetical protein